MKSDTYRIIPVILLLLIAMSVGGVWATFVYSEGEVENAESNASLGVGDFNYDTGNGSFSTKTEMMNFLTDPSNADVVSEKYFGGTLDVTTNEDGTLNLSTPSTTKSVLFTAEFIYELQQVGVKTIVINDFSVSGAFNNIYITYNNYTGASKGHPLGGEWRIDISSPLLTPSGDGYVYTSDGQTSTAQDISLTTSLFNYWWSIGSMSFE